MSEEDLYRSYVVIVRYVPSDGSRPRNWSTTAREISEDDAIWTALREFRTDEIRTWVGWPRSVTWVAVREGTKT
jgi:hypothetical protein